MKEQEELCIKKYSKYAQEAKCSELSELFSSISKTESSHLQSINDMLSGKEPLAPGELSANNAHCIKCDTVYANQQNKASCNGKDAQGALFAVRLMGKPQIYLAVFLQKSVVKLA